ncbi:hypothetical protein [Leuconostoc citreum]|nr:hypothetical protein [Leuconostoc citreum]
MLDGPDVDKAFTRIGDSASKAMGAVSKHLVMYLVVLRLISS